MSAAGKRILVVDDDSSNRGAVAELLAGRGYEAVQAQHGLEALARLEEEAVSLVVLDLLMPVMDGWQFYEQLRRDPRHASVPVMVITAAGTPATGLPGVSAFIKKPIQHSEFSDLVSRLLPPTGVSAD